MAIGKVLQRFWGEKDKNGDRVQTVFIVLTPSFPESKYQELQPGRQYATTLGAGSTLWSESGSQLEVTGVPGYPRLVADSLEKNVTVYGKVTNDDSEALKWIKEVADRLFPSRLFTRKSVWNSKFRPIKDELDKATTAGRASELLSRLRQVSDKRDQEMVTTVYSSGPGNPGTAEIADSSFVPFKDSASGDDSSHAEDTKNIKNAGSQALTDAKNVITNEVGEWWHELGTGYQIAAVAGGGLLLIITAMGISERVD